jgi:cobalamin-dependent methionine synthase I
MTLRSNGPIKTLITRRQQQQKAAGLPNISLVGLHCTQRKSGVKDYIGGFAVTGGMNIENEVGGIRSQSRRL